MTVTTASQICCTVRAMHRTNSAAGNRTTTAVMSAASNIAVPVPSGWNAHTAAYGLSWYSVMATALSSPGQGTLICPLVATLKDDHRITVAETSSQGIQPCHAATGGNADFGVSSGDRTMGNSAVSAGRHTCRNSTVAMSDPSAANTSVRV